jgi:hypothetical protein
VKSPFCTMRFSRWSLFESSIVIIVSFVYHFKTTCSTHRTKLCQFSPNYFPPSYSAKRSSSQPSWANRSNQGLNSLRYRECCSQRLRRLVVIQNASRWGAVVVVYTTKGEVRAISLQSSSVGGLASVEMMRTECVRGCPPSCGSMLV